ncbi:hypothetical protein EVAR_26069_1 [Eumeta japonica]|uniref:Uncharacterized protein n=1 Tax=Eumeta variegata TaxID=151549 RepID=A0A4C1VPE5_EUMVA|nr:hypothetical protein EVAR_26069_1 [Eumeta japonica]
MGRRVDLASMAFKCDDLHYLALKRIELRGGSSIRRQIGCSMATHNRSTSACAGLAADALHNEIHLCILGNFQHSFIRGSSKVQSSGSRRREAKIRELYLTEQSHRADGADTRARRGERNETPEPNLPRTPACL